MKPHPAELRALENNLAMFVCVARVVTPDRVKVTITPEEHDGAEGLRIDVLVDGVVDTEAEELVSEALGIANDAAIVALSFEHGVN